MARATDPEMSRKFDADSPEVSEFVKNLEDEHYNLYRHYLVWLALTQQLGRFLNTHPIRAGDQILDDMRSVIHSYRPNLDISEEVSFRTAVNKRLRRDGHLQKHMKYKPPE